MNTQNVHIISFNNLSLDFWKTHLNLSKANVSHNSPTDEAVNLVENESPEIIIIDTYWSKVCPEAFLEKVISSARNSKIFYLTPEGEISLNLRPLNSNLTVTQLSKEMIQEINDMLSSEINPDNLSLIA